MEATQTIELIVESRLENIPLIGGAVRGIAGALSIDEVTSYHLELCAVEAVTNSIKHAYSLEAGKNVEMSVLLFPGRITFEIRDRGKSLDPARMQNPEFDPEDGETLPESGMGLFIMQSLMDEIAYETKDGLNTLTMSKYLTREGRAA